MLSPSVLSLLLSLVTTTLHDEITLVDWDHVSTSVSHLPRYCNESCISARYLWTSNTNRRSFANVTHLDTREAAVVMLPVLSLALAVWTITSPHLTQPPLLSMSSVPRFACPDCWPIDTCIWLARVLLNTETWQLWGSVPSQWKATNILI